MAQVLRHKIFDKVLRAVRAQVPVCLVGPAGSGKSTLAQQIAEELGVEFYVNGAVDSEYKLKGFMNAYGQPVTTGFLEAYTKGGLFLLDEIDASNPQALVALNGAIANDFIDMPDGRRAAKHPNFYCMAAANTYGRGADRVYVGRNQLDGATLDRFAHMYMDYDEALERRAVDRKYHWWVDVVQSWRAAAEKHKIRHIISPRASINGAKLLAAGHSVKEVADEVVWKGLDPASVHKIREEAKPAILKAFAKLGYRLQEWVDGLREYFGFEPPDESSRPPKELRRQQASEHHPG